MPGRLTVAGVPVDPLTFAQATEKAVDFLSDGRQHLVATPNPEMAVLAERDPSFRKILEGADLALADGFGLVLAGWLEGKRVPEVIPGVTFTLILASIAEQKKYSIFLLGGLAKGLAERAAAGLKENFPELKIAGAEQGGRIRWIAGAWEEDPHLAVRIAASKADILLVALGHGKQERWIAHHLGKMPSVKIAVGVGGTLDFLAGEVWRAPRMLRRLHFEWLWRLVTQPWRAPRIFEATFVFLWMVLKKRLKRVR